MQTITKTLLLIAALTTLSGCLMTPRFEITQHMDFNATLPNNPPRSYEDLLCCHRCQA